MAVIGRVDLVVGMLIGYGDLDVSMLNLEYPFLWRQMAFSIPCMGGHGVWVFSCDQWYGYQSFIVCAGVTACDCTPGCTNVVRESALKAGSGRKIIATLGSHSKMHRQCTRPGAQLNEFHPHLMWWSLIRSFAAVGMCVCVCVHV